MLDRRTRDDDGNRAGNENYHRGTQRNTEEHGGTRGNTEEHGGKAREDLRMRVASAHRTVIRLVRVSKRRSPGNHATVQVTGASIVSAAHCSSTLAQAGFLADEAERAGSGLGKVRD